MSESEISVSSVRQKAEAYSREICKRQDLDWDEDHPIGDITKIDARDHSIKEYLKVLRRNKDFD